MTPPRVLFTVTGTGHEQIHVRDEDHETIGVMQHHRLLSYAWGDLESPWIEEDLREVHHWLELGWLNFEEEIEAMTPERHRDVDEGRARIKTPWDGADQPVATDGGRSA